MTDLMLALVTVSMTVSLIASIVLCICRKAPKQTVRSNNANNLLPLNSIRSSDLQTSQLEAIRYNGTNHMVTDDVDHHLRPHTQRALPDIPSLDNSQHLSIDEYDLSGDRIQSLDDQLKVEVKSNKSRPTKPRAPPPPTHRVMTCPTVSDNDFHHSYARIKDNVVIDSSENETDDYCDPQFCSPAIRNPNHGNEDLSPPIVSTNRYIVDNTELPYIQSNPSTSRAIDEPVLPFLSNPPNLLINHSNIDTYSQSSLDESRNNANRTEISYNTISVREPLAKVLAERANSEHHYNEVEDERVSSFYEEIAGSTASSVTYSKIGDILSNNTNQRESRELSEIASERPSVHPISSNTNRNSAPTQAIHFENGSSSSDPFLGKEYLKDLYSSVDKKTKKSYNRQTIHCVPDSDNEFDNLYAKVQKVHNMPKESALHVNQRPSSVSEVEADALRLGLNHSHGHDHNQPPPLPPPLKSNQSRSARTISLYDSTNSVPNASSHQRRYSSGNQSINTNDWHMRNVAEDYFDYGPVGHHEIDLDNDPGYEVIHKKTSSANKSRGAVDTNEVNGHSELSGDPGYEAIRNDESDFDPNYEVIAKKATTSRKLSEVVEAEYEVIKRVPQKTPHSNRFEISRNTSDVSSEPGYERIRFTQKSISIEQTDSEPNYAFIARKGPFDDEDDDEEGETLSERL